MAGTVRTATDAAQAFALDANALSSLRQQARDAPDQALGKAAGQFEALFLQMVLKQMRETLPKDGPLDSDTMRSYTAMFDQQVAQHLSSRGIGLREAIERQLGKRTNAAEGAKTPASPAAAGDAAQQTASPTRPSPAAGAKTATLLGALTERRAPLPSHAPATSRGAASSPIATMQAFVDRMRPHAEAAAAALGVPAHLLIAQAGLETGWGKSQPKTADGAVSHNVFGVKAGGRWSGASVAAATSEFVQGAAIRTVEKFRAYGSYAAAFNDIAKVLGGTRYADARANAADPEAYARSLQRAGYATDPGYADKLARAIRMVVQHTAAAPSVDAPRLAAAAPVQETGAAADMSTERHA